jgi:carboxymethylenebutenolidase
MKYESNKGLDMKTYFGMSETAWAMLFNTTNYVEYPSPQGYGKLRGYLTQPAKTKGKLPVVLVVHENRGLNPYIEDIARRLAIDNFIAFAPDALYPLGGYPRDEEKARELFSKLDQTKTKEDFVAAFGFLKSFQKAMAKLAWWVSATVAE